MPTETQTTPVETKKELPELVYEGHIEIQTKPKKKGAQITFGTIAFVYRTDKVEKDIKKKVSDLFVDVFNGSDLEIEHNQVYLNVETSKDQSDAVTLDV